jgi:solute carrier family 35 (UDP-xylose/UDP-N-acetylglucosamine transporter), member B4
MFSKSSISKFLSVSESHVPDLIKSVALISAGCIFNNLILEFIVSKKKNEYADPGAGGLMTFLQFIFITVATFPNQFEFNGAQKFIEGKDFSLFKMKPTIVPIRHYVFMTMLFFSMSYLNNLAFAFNISQPMHMVFRSANLMVSYIMGKLFFSKSYTLYQFLSVLLLTMGVASATFAEAFLGDTALTAAKLKPTCTQCGDANANLLEQATVGNSTDSASYMLRWFFGVGILCTVLVLQTLLGNYQSWVGSTFGKAAEEGMFFMHTFSLPAFLLTATDLRSHAAKWSMSPSFNSVFSKFFTIPIIGNLPIMWTYILVNVLSQYMCIMGVYYLCSFADPLTVNVVLTLRKFVSLMISIFVFNNTFTIFHWIGAILVLGGAILYNQWNGPSPAPAKNSSATASSSSTSSHPDESAHSSNTLEHEVMSRRTSPRRRQSSVSPNESGRSNVSLRPSTSGAYSRGILGHTKGI